MVVKRDGHDDEYMAPERIRADAVAAFRVRVARLAAGLEDDESIEAEAGSLLEAKTAVEIHEIAAFARAYREANSKT